MNKLFLSSKESTVKMSDGVEKVDTKLTAYEVYVEAGLDKEGKPVLNRDGSQKYYIVDTDQMINLENELAVKKISDNYFKPLYEVNGDKVEKVERDGKRTYYVVDAESIVMLPAGSIIKETKSGGYKVIKEKGFVVYDETEEDSPKIISVKKFETEDHKEEAESFLKEMNYRHFVPYYKM